MRYGSKLVEEAVERFASLPGVGRKTALRLVLHMIGERREYMDRFAHSITELSEGIKHCKQCHNLTDSELCSVCQNPARNKKLICVVESVRDVMAIEETSQYKGVYHVLGGVISPLEGVTPDDLSIALLSERLEQNGADEVILAISPTIDGETTNFYLYKLLQKHDVQMSQLSRGISYGGELEYADELTLGRSLISRRPYSQSMQ